MSPKLLLKKYIAIGSESFKTCRQAASLLDFWRALETKYLRERLPLDNECYDNKFLKTFCRFCIVFKVHRKKNCTVAALPPTIAILKSVGVRQAAGFKSQGVTCCADSTNWDKGRHQHTETTLLTQLRNR